MFLVGHAAVGVAAVSALGITNPVAAFGVGWISHYLADFLPHGDEPVGEWTKKGNEILRFAGILAVDGSLFLAVFGYYSWTRGISIPLIAAAAGSFVPDVMWGLEMVAHRKLWGFMSKFHARNHNFFHPHLPAWVGLAWQSAATVLLWTWMMAR